MEALIFVSLVLVGSFYGSSAESDEKCGINKYVFCDHLSPKEKLVAVGMVPNAQELPNICPDVLRYFECVSEHSRSCDSTNDPTTKTVNSMLLIVQDICSKDSALFTVYSRHAPCYKRLYETQPAIECEIKAEAVYNSYLLYKSYYGDDIDDSDRTRHRYCMEKSYKTACIATKISEECGSEAHDLFWELIIRSKYLLPICTPEVVKEIQDEFSDYIDEEEMQVKILRGVSEF